MFITLILMDKFFMEKFESFIQFLLLGDRVFLHDSCHVGKANFWQSHEGSGVDSLIILNCPAICCVDILQEVCIHYDCVFPVIVWKVYKWICAWRSNKCARQLKSAHVTQNNLCARADVLLLAWLLTQRLRLKKQPTVL